MPNLQPLLIVIAKGLGDELGENTKTEVVLWTTAEKC